MTFITKKHISRRTVLRATGTAIALPLLDSMVPAQTPMALTAGNPVPRLGFVYVPHGMIMDKWTPVSGAENMPGLKLNEIMSPLAQFQDRLVVVSGLAHKTADNAGPHALSPTTWLSGVRPKATEGEDVMAATTVDQMAAAKIGQDTQYPSMELATEDHYGLIGACDTGYSCTYLNTLSWKTPTTPLPMEINPRVVFERMFGEGGSTEQRAARMKEDASILDAITKEAGSFQKDLGARDRTRVTEFLENVREIERRIQSSMKSTSSKITPPGVPVGVPESFEEHCKLMFDLTALAYQGDITRVTTFMMARELSQRTYPQVGAPDPHHALSHHQNDPERIAKLVKLQNYHIQMFAYYLEKLRSTPDGDGNLLDHITILYGGNMSNSNLHSHFPLPNLIAGGANGKVRGNRHIKAKDQTPMSNLLLTMLEKTGVVMDHVGDSTDRIGEL